MTKPTKTRQNKTVPTKIKVADFVRGVENPTRRADTNAVLKLMRAATGKRAQMWGESIIGFGRYEYQYASGREGEFFLTGLSPRKQSLVIYIMGGFEAHEKLLAKLGKHKRGKSCLYINKLADVDQDVLTRLITNSVKLMRKKHGVVA
ncbi:MAG: DUF1801 domain-containing protein [Pseudomonadaceae bacterium]|nr:DUF1801 domain-containing protein [Pseudomonadaceae bacterium]